jgi:hypothetical protein
MHYLHYAYPSESITMRDASLTAKSRTTQCAARRCSLKMLGVMPEYHHRIELKKDKTKAK